MYREIFVPVDNSQHSDWAVDRAIEMCRKTGGRITGNHVYAARLHDVRFRQLETGLPAQFQTPAEIKKQRKIHDKLIEKGLQLIADSFLDQLGKRCESAGVPLTRQLLEGINYEEIVNEVNRGAGRLPGLIGFDPNRAAGYDGGDKVRSDVKLGANGRLVAVRARLWFDGGAYASSSPAVIANATTLAVGPSAMQAPKSTTTAATSPARGRCRAGSHPSSGPCTTSCSPRRCAA